jgi:hypothetical protein
MKLLRQIFEVLMLWGKGMIVFASFWSEEQDEAMSKLKGIVYKGNILDVKVNVIIFLTSLIYSLKLVSILFLARKACAWSCYKKRGNLRLKQG